MLTQIILNFSSVFLSDMALRFVLFGELFILVLIYWAMAKFSRRSLWIGAGLLVVGVLALLPGYLYVQETTPEDAVIDVSILLYYPLELTALLLAIFAFQKRQSQG